jgi:hypothetical protein
VVRFMLLMLLPVCLGLCTANTSSGQPNTLKLGEKLEGDLKEEKSYVWPGGGGRLYGYGAEIPVSLKAGQEVSITATVIGTNRKVSVALQDPAGKIIAGSPRNNPKTVELRVEEVSTSGKYMILVMSDQIGAYTLRASGGSDTDTPESLQNKIKELEKELEAAKAKLKALEDKSKK